MTVQALARGQTLMERHRLQLASGASSEGIYEHEGEEFPHILSGSLEIVLDAGGSFYFESRRPHAWRNAREQDAVVVWINTPSSF